MFFQQLFDAAREEDFIYFLFIEIHFLEGESLNPFVRTVKYTSPMAVQMLLKHYACLSRLIKEIEIKDLLRIAGIRKSKEENDFFFHFFNVKVIVKKND